jgi:hypothetical protein
VIILNVLQTIGRAFSGLRLSAVWRCSRSRRWHCVRSPYYWRLLLRQMIDIGYYCRSSA